MVFLEQKTPPLSIPRTPFSSFAKCKQCIGPVVATALLLIGAVVAVTGFNTWFNYFHSSSFSGIEQQSNQDSSLNVQGLIGDILYLKSGNSNNLTLLKILDKNSNIQCEFSGTTIVNSSGLVGWWKLNDESSVIEDLSGNGNNGTLYGNTRLLLDFDDGTATDKTGYQNNGTLLNGVDCSGSGINGKGCSFDGVNDYINISYN